MSVTLTRELAYDAFIQVMFHQSRADTVLEKTYEKHQNLRRLDKNFIKELLYGSLRWYSKIYWILNQTAKRDLSECSYEVQTALILGSYQIYYMDKVPDRAAVNESVEYIRKKKQLKACSFVNGILRQIARKTQYFPKPDKDEQIADYFAVQYAHPKWLIDRWLNKDEIKPNVLEKILISNNKAPACFIRVSPLNVDACKRIQKFGFDVGTHIIWGTPFDINNDKLVVDTARFLSDLKVHSVKIHNLYVPNNSKLADIYKNNNLEICSKKDYINMVILFLEHLSSKIVVERLVSDVPLDQLLAPSWLVDKNRIIEEIIDRMDDLDSWQGKKYENKQE